MAFSKKFARHIELHLKNVVVLCTIVAVPDEFFRKAFNGLFHPVVEE